MTQASSFPLLTHPAFNGLSEIGSNDLQKATRLLKFELGQQMCDAEVIPARVLVLLSGQARLVGRQMGRLTTVGKFGPGSVIGAASLLTGSACENVIASDDVVACAIPDQVWSELYASEASFRAWCDQQVWPQELLQLLERLDRGSADADESPLEQLEQALQGAVHCAPTPESVGAAIAAGQLVYVTSCWGEARVGQQLDAASVLPESDRFALRLVALAAPEAADGEDPPAPLVCGGVCGASSPCQSLQPRAQCCRQPEHLIRAEGPIPETLACFQMLTQLMKLPFRRDSIEKVLQDNIRRGLKPSLQLCGQLAASLGLHVMGAKVPAVSGTRLQVPSMLPWKDGFALVVASNEQGLKLASPKHGMVVLAPDELEESFPEGIELLLMERSNATPDQKFGPGWFWPALKRYRSVLIQVLAASFVVQLFTLANPLLIQVIIDKVISQRSLDTLQVLGFALVVVTILEGILIVSKHFYLQKPPIESTRGLALK